MHESKLQVAIVAAVKANKSSRPVIATIPSSKTAATRTKNNKKKQTKCIHTYQDQDDQPSSNTHKEKGNTLTSCQIKANDWSSTLQWYSRLLSFVIGYLLFDNCVLYTKNKPKSKLFQSRQGPILGGEERWEIRHFATFGNSILVLSRVCVQHGKWLSTMKT